MHLTKQTISRQGTIQPTCILSNNGQNLELRKFICELGHRPIICSILQTTLVCPWMRYITGTSSRLIDWLYGVKRRFQQYFSYIAAPSAPIHAFLEFVLSSTPHSMFSKPTAAFPHNHRGNNGQRWERNEKSGCRNDYHRSSERILPEPGSNQWPPFLKSCTLSTELSDSAEH